MKLEHEGKNLDWSKRKQIERICDSFEVALRAGESPHVADFASEIVGDHRSDAQRELLLLKLEYGSQVTPEELDGLTATDRITLEQAIQERVQSETKNAAVERTVFLMPRRLAPGTAVGPYKIEGTLGTGGVGIVYRAVDTRMDRSVALKFLHLEFVEPENQADVRARFLEEPRAVASLHQHDNIVTVYNMDEQDGVPFFSMQLIEGPSLKQLVQDQSQSETALDLKQIAAIARDVASALDHAHKSQVLHRDITPSNILVERGRAYVTDFGLAKTKRVKDQRTLTGLVVGTIGYLSPEQATGSSQVDARSDIYGLGATLYYMLAGRPPFQSSTPYATLQEIRHSDPVRVRKLNSVVDKDLETICHKCLEKLPSTRYQTAGELHDDLERYLSGKPIQARPVSWMAKSWMWCRRYPATATAICLALMLALASIAWGTRNHFLGIQLVKEEAASQRAESESAAKSARIAMQRGRWQKALDDCDIALAGEVEPIDILLMKSDAYVGLGDTQKRQELLESIDTSSADRAQQARIQLRLAAVALLSQGKQASKSILSNLEVDQLPPAEKAFAESMQASSHQEALPCLYACLETDPWHFEAFCQLLALLLVTDQSSERLNDYIGHAQFSYPEDPNTHLAIALASAANEREVEKDAALAVCRDKLSPKSFENVSCMVQLIDARRELEVPWYKEVARLNIQTAPLKLRLFHDGQSKEDSYLLMVLRSMLSERYRMLEPEGLGVNKAAGWNLFSFKKFKAFSKSHIAELEKAVERQADAVTLCVLAEAHTGKWLEAEEYARRAISAPTLYPRIRQYACAFAAVCAKSEYDRTKEKEHLDRAAAYVRQRLAMGPLRDYATSQPLGSVALAAKDFASLNEVVQQLLPTNDKKIDLQILAALNAHHHGDYVEALRLSKIWYAAGKRVKSKSAQRDALEIIESSSQKLREMMEIKVAERQEL